jgi:hypothetical protein
MGYDKKKLACLLRVIYDHTTTNPDAIQGDGPLMVVGGRGSTVSIASAKGVMLQSTIDESAGPSIVVRAGGVAAFEEFLDETVKDEEINEFVGRDAIAKHVKSFLQSTDGKLPVEPLDEVIRFKILKPLREDIHAWVAFLPVVNLVVKCPLTLGSVEFVAREAAQKESSDFIQTHRHQLAGTEDEQDQQKNGLLNAIDRFAKQSHGYAKVSFRAHEGNVGNVSTNVALVALNVLRSHTHLFSSHSQRAFFGLPVEMSRGNWQRVAYSPGRRLHLLDSSTGPLIPFELNHSTIRHLQEKCHLDLVQEILMKPANKRNSLEAVLLDSFQALGRAVVAPTTDLFFLGCTIALERLLIRDREETTTERWSDRLAIVVSDDPEERDNIIRRAKRLYDERSRVVHAAYSGVSCEDAELMEWWAIMAILKTLGQHKNYSSHEAFCQSVDPRTIGLQQKAQGPKP